LFAFSAFSYAQQLSSGIIDPSRAIDWSSAGIPGGLPDSGWTQCGSTIAPYSGSSTAINKAIAACGVNQYVSLGSGTFNLSSGIDFNHKSNVAIRGQGADSTLLVFTGAGAGGYNSVVAMEGSLNGVGYEQNVCNWTGGYSKGSTTVTLGNCGSTTPAVGSLSNLQVGSILVLDQLDNSYDTGAIWNCYQSFASNPNNLGACSSGPNDGNGGFARTDGTCTSSPTNCHRSQQQVVVVTGISGSSITISPGIYMPNWSSGQLPQAWFANTTVKQDGVENLSIDNTNDTAQSPGNGHNISIVECYQCWVSGVRSIYAERSHIALWITSHDVVQSSYFYQNLNHATVSYGVEMAIASDNLIVNNIVQQSTDSSPSCTGGCEGNVVAYNFDINSVYTSPGWMQPTFYQHSSGDALNLWEGNIGPGYNADPTHGTHHFETLFRNYFAGWQMSCDQATCSSQTAGILLAAGSRYLNIVGNVLGQSGYHTAYQCLASPTCNPGNPNASSVYALGHTGGVGAQQTGVSGYCLSPACTSRGDYDPQVSAYLMRWGNYDPVTGTVRWCGGPSDTGWSTTCASISEIPAGLASYANPLPSYGDTGAGQSKMPPSFYYSNKPNWWQGEPWPPIGPDVSSGNIGICSGGAYKGAYTTQPSACTGGSMIAAAEGHASSTPALDCYVNAMGGPPDGSGGVLTFNASNCYGSSGGTPPAPPTGLTVVVH